MEENGWEIRGEMGFAIPIPHSYDKIMLMLRHKNRGPRTFKAWWCGVGGGGYTPLAAPPPSPLLSTQCRERTLLAHRKLKIMS